MPCMSNALQAALLSHSRRLLLCSQLLNITSEAKLYSYRSARRLCIAACRGERVGGSQEVRISKR